MLNADKKRNFIINVLYWALLIAIIFVLFKYFIPLVMPFLIAYAISALMRPIIARLNSRWKLRWNIAAILMVLVFYSTVGTLIVLAVIKLIAWLQSVLTLVPALYTNTIAPALTTLLTNLGGIIEDLDPTVAETLYNVAGQAVNSLGSAVTNLSMGALGTLSGIAVSLPGILINILITIIATFFMAADYPRISAFVRRQLPGHTADILSKIKHQIGEIIGQFLRSYCLIMLITFCELSVGFLILKLQNPFAIALLIAIFDVLPVLGTGGVLIPWSAIALVIGNYGMALGVILLYVVVTVVRQVVEPRIIGKQVGIHPVITLISMFVGAKLFGVIGLFGLPITCAILRSLNEKEVIHILK